MTTTTPSLPRFEDTPLNTPERLAADLHAALAVRPAWLHAVHLEYANPDPHLREARSFVDSMLKNLPGYSQTLPPVRDVFGEPVARRIGITTDQKADEVEAEHNRIMIETGKGLGKPDPKFEGVDLRDVTLPSGQNAFDRLQELSAHIPGQPGDVLLVEQVDRLSRLNAADWEKLKAEIASKRVRVVALDLPTSHQLIQPGADEFSARMLDAINGMMLDMLAAIARKDYEDRRRRQTQGIQKAKAAGAYKGRPEDTERNAALMDMLRRGQTWASIVKATGVSTSTLSRLAKRIKEEA